MTKEEILAIKAGEKLDNLVTKELFHHVWDDGDRPRCKICGVWKDWPNSASIGCEGKKYSTDISAAWLVVEKMRESDDYNFKRMQSGKKKPGGYYLVRHPGAFYGQYDDTFVEFCAHLMEILGVTVTDSVIDRMAGRPAELPEYPYPATLTLMRKLSPEAICKAALLAKLGFPDTRDESMK